jgi:hypothetical protein
MNRSTNQGAVDSDVLTRSGGGGSVGITHDSGRSVPIEFIVALFLSSPSRMFMPCQKKNTSVVKKVVI